MFLDYNAVMPESSERKNELVGRTGFSVGPWVRFMLACVIVVGGDLYLKSWAFAHLADRPVVLTPAMIRADDPLADYQLETRVVVPKTLALRLVLNRGAVFGVGQGAQVLFIGASILAVLALPVVVYRSRARQGVVHIGVGLILGGALGNLYDRVMFQMVRDMLWLFPGVNLPFGWTWGNHQRGLYPWIFNPADAALLLGVGLLMIVLWREPGKDVTADASGEVGAGQRGAKPRG